MEKIKPATILLVEDDPGDQKLITVSLKNQKLGNEVYTADSGEEAMDFLYQRGKYSHGTSRPDLILLDWMLPGASGLDFAQQLRRDDSTRELPVVMLTARDAEEDMIRGLEGGVDDYLTKPFDKAELMARIQAIVRRSQGHSQSIIKTGKLAVNLDASTVEVDGRPIHLSGKE